MNNENKMKILSVVFFIVIIIFWIQFIHNNIGGFIDTLYKINFSVFILTFPVLLVTYFLVIHNWKTLLEITGKKITFQSAARLWLIPNLAKYIPGTIWMPLARGVYGKGDRIPLSNTYVAWFLEIYLQVSASILISIFYMFFFQNPIPTLFPLMLILFLVTISFLFKNIEIASRMITKIKKLEKTKKIISLVKNINIRKLIKPLLIYILINIIYGLWLMLITMCVSKFNGDILFFIFCWSISWIIGFVTIFVPGGIGIREGIITFILMYVGYTNSAAIIIAFLTRIQIFILDTILVCFIKIKNKALPIYFRKTTNISPER